MRHCFDVFIVVIDLSARQGHLIQLRQETPSKGVVVEDLQMICTIPQVC